MTDAIDELLAAWMADPDRADRIAHVHVLAERTAIHQDIEPPLPARLAAGLEERGITRLWRHQARLISAARSGSHSVLVAGTASGKTLGYQVPIVEAVAAGGTAIAIYPTKALAQDQLRSFDSLGVEGLIAETYDGDTPRDRRPWIRRNANVILTNPDMLHVGVLPGHERWSQFLARLRYVVVDEVHTLRGIFGSNVAHVFRRLRRVADHYEARPTWLFTSATIGNPGDLASALTGLPVTPIIDEADPVGERALVLWNPPLDPDDPGRRTSSLSETTDVYADLVRSGLHTIAFTRSRRATELIHRWASDRLDPELAARLAPYRAGYLPEERRRIEQALFSGELLGVTATNALELGIDVGNLDAAVVSTFPGTLASFRQQVGRAGRTRRRALGVLVAGQDALDQYYMAHPDELLTREPEAAVVNPDNPNILAKHVACAAYELPLRLEDREYFGEGLEEVVAELVRAGDLRLRDERLYWARRRRPAAAADIRATGGLPLVIATDAAVIGTIDRSRAPGQAHPGAVYLHQGETFVVDELDLEQGEVRVHPERVNYYTQPKEDKDLLVLDTSSTARVGLFHVHLGRVEVDSQIVAYQRKSISSGEVIDTVPLDLPRQTLRTEAFWVEVPDAVIRAADIEWRELPGTLHAAEHTAIAMLPLFAICDRWDVGGLSTAIHSATGGAVWFIYDGYDGGAGIAPIGFANAERHLRATLEALRQCPCVAGCPSCVVSPKCGNFNEPLSKDGAIALLEAGLETEA